MYTITTNTAFNSLEIAFDSKPSEAVREALKALKFRWHKVKKVWYGFADQANGFTITTRFFPGCLVCWVADSTGRIVRYNKFSV